MTTIKQRSPLQWGRADLKVTRQTSRTCTTKAPPTQQTQRSAHKGDSVVCSVDVYTVHPTGVLQWTNDEAPTITTNVNNPHWGYEELIAIGIAGFHNRDSCNRPANLRSLR